MPNIFCLDLLELLCCPKYTNTDIKNKTKDDFTRNITKINFVAPETDLNKILWNNKKMEAKAANQSLAFNLILYLLGNMVDDEKLLQDYRQILKNDTIDIYQ